ncbi:MAG: hypothetical protein ACOZQL_01310 [Myxococcota bacterium]
MRWLAASTAVLAAACGAPAGSSPTLAVVERTPLAGTIDGAPWVARSAVASARRAFDDGGSRWIDVGAGAFTCADFVPRAELIGTVRWTPTAYELSLRDNLTFVVERADGGIGNLVATTGRVEVVSAPGPDAGPALLRIRARFDARNEVEGEVAVTVCD